MRFVWALALICVLSTGATAQTGADAGAQCVVTANASFSARRVAVLGPAWGGAEFFPNQDRVVITRRDNSVALVNSHTGALMELYAPAAEAFAFEQSPTGEVAFWIDNAGVVTMRNTLTGAVVAQPEALQGRPRDPRSYERRHPRAVFSRDGTRLGVRTLSGSLVLLDGRTGEVVGGAVDGESESELRFAQRDERLVLIDEYGGVVINARTGERLYSMIADATSDRLRFNGDGTRVIVEDDERWRLVDPQAGRQLAENESDYEEARFVDGGAFVLARNGENDTSRLIDTQSGAVVARFDDLAHTTGYVSDFGIQFSPDHRTVVTRASDGTARLWDLSHARFVADLGQYSVSSQLNMSDEELSVFDPAGPPRPTGEFRFSADGSRLVTRSQEGWIGIWDVRTGRMMRSLARLRDHQDGYWTSADAGVIVVLEANRTTVWDTHRAHRLASLRRFDPRTVHAIELSPNADRMVISDSESAELWDLRRGRRLARLAQAGGFPNVAVSRDGRYVAIGDEEEDLQLWDWHDGRLIASLAPTWWGEYYDVGGRSLLLAANGDSFSIHDARNGTVALSCPTARLGADDLQTVEGALLILVRLDEQSNTELWRVELAQ